MRHFVVLSLLVLTGCEYSLRIPFPRVEKYDPGTEPPHIQETVTIQPSSPALGETVTITYSGLAPSYNYSLYLTTFGGGSGGGRAPDPQDPHMAGQHYKIGNLAPINEIASVSFDVRPMMGNDQFGAPFKLSQGQLVTLTLKGILVDKPTIDMEQQGGSGSFLIR